MSYLPDFSCWKWCNGGICYGGGEGGCVGDGDGNTDGDSDDNDGGIVGVV